MTVVACFYRLSMLCFVLLVGLCHVRALCRGGGRDGGAASYRPNIKTQNCKTGGHGHGLRATGTQCAR
jgi:hypothetical protein